MRRRLWRGWIWSGRWQSGGDQSRRGRGSEGRGSLGWGRGRVRCERRAVRGVAVIAQVAGKVWVERRRKRENNWETGNCVRLVVERGRWRFGEIARKRRGRGNRKSADRDNVSVPVLASQRTQDGQSERGRACWPIGTRGVKIGAEGREKAQTGARRGFPRGGIGHEQGYVSRRKRPTRTDLGRCREGGSGEQDEGGDASTVGDSWDD